jgi:hypothetical protein
MLDRDPLNTARKVNLPVGFVTGDFVNRGTFFRG